MYVPALKDLKIAYEIGHEVQNSREFVHVSQLDADNECTVVKVSRWQLAVVGNLQAHNLTMHACTDNFALHEKRMSFSSGPVNKMFCHTRMNQTWLLR